MLNKDLRTLERDLHKWIRSVQGADKICRQYERGMITLPEAIRAIHDLELENLRK